MKTEFIKLPCGIQFVAYLSDRSPIHAVLGTIKKKNDGRIEWTRKGSSYFPQYAKDIDGRCQGVCDTIDEAKKELTKI